MFRCSAIPAACLSLAILPAQAQQATVPIDSIPLETVPSPAPTYQATPQPQPQLLPQPQMQPQAQPSAPAGAAPVLRGTHGNWEIRCIGQSDCVMTQMHQRGPNSADAVFTVIKPQGMTDPQGNRIEAFAEIVVPLGVYLPGGLGLKVDDQPARAAPFERCISEGCVVRAPISSSMIEAMRRGSTATIVIFSAPEQPVQIPISLSGFTAAFQAI